MTQQKISLNIVPKRYRPASKAGKSAVYAASRLWAFSLEPGMPSIVLNSIYWSYMQIHACFYFNHIIYYGLLISCCQNAAAHLYWQIPAIYQLIFEILCDKKLFCSMKSFVITSIFGFPAINNNFHFICNLLNAFVVCINHIVALMRFQMQPEKGTLRFISALSMAFPQGFL